MTADAAVEMPRGYELQRRLPELRPRFLELHRRMLREQWGADDADIDWSRAPIVESYLAFADEMREIRAHFIADCYCAEEFTLAAVGRRLDQLEGADEKLCYVVMIGDEYRHAEVLGRYQRMLGLHRTPDPRLVEDFEWSETLDAEAFCIVSLVGETLALPALPAVWRSTRDPLLRAFLPKVWRDEKRHTDFCRLYLECRALRWSPARRGYLDRVLREIHGRQLRNFLEPNPVLCAKLPEPLRWMIQRAGRSALRKAEHDLALAFEKMGLALPC
jgi:hypothetical protein